VKATRHSGFTLIEVLVALMVVALGLTALMVTVSGTARTSGYLRDKALAQWIALNRIVEVRLNLVQFGQNKDLGELDYANRRWHYDTRYFDTSNANMRRVVVRVWAGDTATKGNPLAESIGFLGQAIAQPGLSNVDWRVGSVPVGGPGQGPQSTVNPDTGAAPKSPGALIVPPRAGSQTNPPLPTTQTTPGGGGG
jgi:general secretion pathway protein I